MRRRRNADAPTASSEPEVQISETPEIPIAESAVPSAGVPATGDADTPAEDAPPPKTRRRRAPAVRQATETEEVAPVLAAEALPPAPITAIPEDVPEKPRRSRGGSTRRRAGTEPTPAAETEPAPVDTAVTPPAEVEAPDASVPEAETRPSRRRGGGDASRSRRGGRAAANTPAEDAVALPAEPVAPDDTTDASAAEDEPSAASSKSRRTRGGRRRSSAAAPADASPTTTSDDSVAATPPPPSATADETGGSGRQRVRGVRRQPAATTAAAAPATATVVTPVSVAPVEPLPPPYQPLPAETLARLTETKVVVRKNVPELIVNGEPRLPLWFFVNTDDPDLRDIAQREIRMAYEAGVRFFSVLAHLPWRTRSGERRYDPLDDALQFVADNAPDAFLLPRLIFSPPASWERANPDEMTRYADGETGDISLASRAFWEGEADAALRAAVEHVAEGPHAGRVFGFFFEHGEWFHEKGRGYDVSEANTQGFRAWLRARYKNSQVNLRASWHDGSVTFDTAGVPPTPSTVAGQQPLFFTAREQRWVDFHEYSSDIVAQVITRLGKAVKEASGGRSAVAVSYGYTLELPRAGSGHLALAQVLASPNVDILTGPVSYSARMPGGSAPLPAPIDSVILAGKLWVSEDDTKTFLSVTDTPDTYNPKLNSFEATWAAYARNFGAAQARGTGISWMDLWGLGWLDDRELWQRISGLRAIADGLATRRRNPRTRPAPEPEVAVIVDERSFFDVRADESLLGHLIAHQRDCLLRSGARIGFYLLSDLLKKNFPEGPRLLIFLNAFHLPEPVRAVIRERFQRDGRTLAWVYGPGCRESNIAELTDVIGMQVRHQSWGSKMGTQVFSNARSPLTDALRGQRLGDETRVNPSYCVADAKATPLAEYVATGNTSIAVRKHAHWQSVFIGEMTLPVPLLRGLYRLAGIQTYTVDDDVAWIGDNLLCLHSAPGGGTTLYLPEEGVLYDLLNQETLASDGFGARLSMPPRGSRLLFYGTAAEVTRLGGDPRDAPPGLTRSELPAAPAPFVGEPTTGAAATPDISPEDEALMRAALAGEFGDAEPTEDFEDVVVPASPEPVVAAITAGTTDPATAEQQAGEGDRKKRRRRRRGRGRGGIGDAEGAENPDAPDDGAPDEDENGSDGEDDAAAPQVDSTLPAGDSAVTPSGPRTRPSLEELLPLSESVADGVDLPIPDEFLPVETHPSSEDPATETGTSPTATRRRRGSGGGTTGARRGRRPSAPAADATNGSAEAIPLPEIGDSE